MHIVDFRGFAGNLAEELGLQSLGSLSFGAMPDDWGRRRLLQMPFGHLASGEVASMPQECRCFMLVRPRRCQNMLWTG